MITENNIVRQFGTLWIYILKLLEWNLLIKNVEKAFYLILFILFDTLLRSPPLPFMKRC